MEYWVSESAITLTPQSYTTPPLQLFSQSSKVFYGKYV